MAIARGSIVRTGFGVHEASSLRLCLHGRESGALLRERLCLWLEELGVAGDVVFDLSLAASEAFANAVEHPHEPAARPIEVDGDFSDSTVTITVRDFGSWGAPRQREEGGYGFRMMRRLVDSVEIERGAAGTSVTLLRRVAELRGR
jgi:anti-sigma regulatory factor (Ser/Thr protein kinase)